jgi:CheY-like chemotaxis protein
MTFVKQVLLIDDDVDDQEIFCIVLEKTFPRITCEIAGNGEDGLRKLTTNNLPQLIFLDLNMPLMNGQQFLKVAKKDDRLKEIPIVILSTSSDKETISETLSLGAMSFITKPDKFSDWEIKLREAFSLLSKSESV